RRELLRIGGEDETGTHEPEDMPELAEVLRHERVRGRHGCDRDADVLAAEREQGMVDAVVREDGHRTLGAEPEIEERLAYAARGIQGLSVRELAPPFALALREEDALRRALGPLHEPIRHAAHRGAEGLGRAQE